MQYNGSLRLISTTNVKPVMSIKVSIERAKAEAQTLQVVS